MVKLDISNKKCVVVSDITESHENAVKKQQSLGEDDFCCWFHRFFDSIWDDMVPYIPWMGMGSQLVYQRVYKNWVIVHSWFHEFCVYDFDPYA